jgi:hypothetical protein
MAKSKFYAWGGGPAPFSFGIGLQISHFDKRCDRQCLYWKDGSSPGHLQVDRDRIAWAVGQVPDGTFFFGDEPDAGNFPAEEYAAAYHDFADAVKAVSQAAKVSPAAFTSFGQTRNQYHQEFFDRYKQMYHAPPPVDEWRFNIFYDHGQGVDLDTWKQGVKDAAAWSIQNGAHLVLGAFGAPPVLDSVDLTWALRQAMRILCDEDRVVAAVYWSLDVYEPGGTKCYHTLTDRNQPDKASPDGIVFLQEMWGIAGGQPMPTVASTKIGRLEAINGWFAIESEVYPPGAYVFCKDPAQQPVAYGKALVAAALGKQIQITYESFDPAHSRFSGVTEVHILGFPE